MQPINSSFHSYLLKFNPHYYYTADYYSPTSELLYVVMNSSKKNFQVNKFDIWTSINYKDTKIPIQGWKIHVSASLENHKEVLSKVSNYCINNCIPFKFASDTNIFIHINSKGMPRQAAGKFITIYPLNEDGFYSSLEELDKLLKNYEGPFILSDRRYKNSKVLYYRYGNLISNNKLNSRGEKESYLMSPTNELILDKRQPYFYAPDWIQDKLFINEPNETNTEIFLNNRYEITNPIHFSNSGGVYKAIDRITGQQVIVKEARPHTSVDKQGNDSVIRLKNEYEKLKYINNLNLKLVPEPLNFFNEWEHDFLVMEWIPFKDLAHIIFTQNPFITGVKDPTEFNTYFSKLSKVWENILESFIIFKNHKLIINDISFKNILINEDTNEIKFIDLEGSYFEHDNVIPIETPGFRLKEDSNDIYILELKKLGYLILSSIFPFNNMLEFSNDKSLELIEFFNKKITSFDAFSELLSNLVLGKINIDQALNTLKLINSSNNFYKLKEDSNFESNPFDFSKKIENSIYKNINLNDNYQLYPSDPAGSVTNTLNLSYGSYGIINALYARNEYKLNPLIEKSLYWSLTKSIDSQNYTSGLYVGTAGIAWVLGTLGMHQYSNNLMELANNNINSIGNCYNLFYGLAGNGLANLKLFNITSNQYYLMESIKRAEEILAAKNIDSKGNYFWVDDADDSIYFGFGKGSSGISMFLLYLYLETENNEYLEAGLKALHYDLDKLFVNENGLLAINRGSSHEQNFVQIQSPYVYDGLAGIGIILLKYLRVSDDQNLLNYSSSILNSILNCEFTVFPGYMRGLSGIIDYLIDYYQYNNNPEILNKITNLINILPLYYAKDYDTEGILGEQLYRLSNDYATGSAGVLIVLHRFLNIDNKFTINPNFNLDNYYLTREGEKV